MKPGVAIAALTAVAGLSSAAIAQRPTPAAAGAAQPPATIVAEPVAMMIAACDANADAIVSRAELATCLARSFAGADAGHTGSIGYIAYGDWARLWLGDANALPSPFEIDSDGDNRITLAELQARFDAIFTRLDRDHDDRLTRAELLTIRSGVGTSDRAPGKRGNPRRGHETP